MFNNVALGVVIGLVFIYLLYSLLATIIQEIIATNMGMRGRTLNRAIKRMLDDESGGSEENLSATFYKHPLIKYLADDSWPLPKKPSYITNETFAKVVIDLLRGKNILAGSSDKLLIQQSLNAAKTNWDTTVSIEPQTLLFLQSVWTDAQGDVLKFKGALEAWFDETMARTVGWYKRYTQIWLLGVGIVIAVLFNVDTIRIVRQLQNDPVLRGQIIAQATDFTKAHPDLDKQLEETKLKLEKINKPVTKPDTIRKNSLQAKLEETQKTKDFSDSLYSKATSLINNDLQKVNTTLALGWPDKTFCENFKSVTCVMVLGWLLTALALSMGAPFWFDLLNKLMQLRGSKAPDNGVKAKAANATPNKAGRVG